MKLLQFTGYYFLGYSLILLVAGGAGLYWGLGKLFDHEMDELLLGTRSALIEELNQRHVQDTLLHLMDDVVLVESVSEISDREVFADTLLWIEEGDELEAEPYRRFTFDTLLNGQPARVSLMESKYENELLLSSIVTLVLVMMVLLFLLLNGLNQFLSSRIWRPFTHAIAEMTAFRVDQTEPFSVVPTNITEFQQLQEAAAAMTAKMQSDYLALKQFSENASHEIQTPLAIIRSQIDLLLQEEHPTEARAGHLTQIREAADRLSRLNQALLLLTRIENRQYAAAARINLRSVIDKKLDSFRLMAEAKSIRITVSLSDCFAHIHPDLADSLVSNLLGNAVRHNVPSGFLDLHLEAGRLIIRNSGRPLSVPPETLFQRFRKGSDSSRSNGLGLAIVKEICQQAGWDIAYTVEEGIHRVEVNQKIQ